MKYKVTISQSIKYTNDIVGYFHETETVGMYSFIDHVITHFENAEVSIERITDEEVDE